MLLGKRIQRTTSMSQLFDDFSADRCRPQPRRQIDGQESTAGGHVSAVLPLPRGKFVLVETAPFLRACGLCRRPLGPGRDTFMYRGDIAFCSLECRQQQMNLDERKEKCSLTSTKDAS